ncbi:MAG: type II secretion system protein [Cyanobacteriota bacterium]
MARFRQPLQSRRRAAAPGFSLLEPLVVSILVVAAVASSVTLLQIANRRQVATRQLVETQRLVDDNIRQIRVLARRYTCCTGECTTAAPPANRLNTATGTNPPNAPCLTADWRDDRFYYPAMDLTTTTANFPNTTTPSEPNAVDQLCANNTNFMTPFQTAVNAVPIPNGDTGQPIFTRATEIQPFKTLRVTFTDTNNRVAREIFVRPTMANFCI